MTKYYAASTNGFYSKEIHGDEIPADSVEITDEEWIALLEGQEKGKLITADKKGNPILQDYPAPTADQVIKMAAAEKTRLLALATVKIGPLQDAEDLDIATAEEAENLKKWKKYRVLLNRVDTNTSDDISWPVAPE